MYVAHPGSAVVFDNIPCLALTRWRVYEPVHFQAETQARSIIIGNVNIIAAIYIHAHFYSFHNVPEFEESDILTVHKFLMIGWNELLTVSFHGNGYRYYMYIWQSK